MTSDRQAKAPFTCNKKFCANSSGDVSYSATNASNESACFVKRTYSKTKYESNPYGMSDNDFERAAMMCLTLKQFGED